MTDAQFVAKQTGAPGWLLDATLAMMAVLFAAGLAAESVPTGLALGLTAHVAVSLYHGRFARFRTLTWTLLFLGWTVSFLIGFFGYVLPWGQMSFWLAQRLGSAAPSLFWEYGGIESLRTNLIFVAGAVFVIGALLDVVALHAPRLRTSRVAQLAAAFLALVVVAAIVRDVMHLITAVPPRPRMNNGPVLPPIVPPTEFLPFYALLRAGPTKSLGVALPPLVAILAALWPWRRAWRFHAAPTRRTFTLLWLMAGAGWVGLGVLGAQPPDPWVIAASQVLALYELVFLAAVPFVLARFLRPADDGRAEVF